MFGISKSYQETVIHCKRQASSYAFDLVKKYSSASAESLGEHLSYLYPWYHWIVKRSKGTNKDEKFPGTNNTFRSTFNDVYFTVIWVDVELPPTPCSAMTTTDKVEKLNWLIPFLETGDDIYYSSELTVSIPRCGLPSPNPQGEVSSFTLLTGKWMGFNDDQSKLKGE